MTREVLKENWHIIEAFVNGSEIQYLEKNGEWDYTDNISLLNHIKYRIKPKQEYIPFDYSDAEYLIGKSVMDKYGNHYHLVLYVYAAIGQDLKIELSGEDGNISALWLFNDYVFLDGSPCGKLKQ